MRISVNVVQDETGANLELVTLDRKQSEVTARLPINPDAAEAEVTSYAALLLRAMPGMDEWAVRPKCIALRGRDILRVVSIWAEKGEERTVRPRRVYAGDRLRAFLLELFADGEPRMSQDVLRAIDKAGFKLSTTTIDYTRKKADIGTRKLKEGWEWYVLVPEMIEEQDQDQPLEKAS